MSALSPPPSFGAICTPTPREQPWPAGSGVAVVVGSYLPLGARQRRERGAKREARGARCAWRALECDAGDLAGLGSEKQARRSASFRRAERYARRSAGFSGSLASSSERLYTTGSGSGGAPSSIGKINREAPKASPHAWPAHTTGSLSENQRKSWETRFLTQNEMLLRWP